MGKFLNYFVGLVLGALRAALSLLFCTIMGVFLFIYIMYEAISGRKDPWNPLQTAKEIVESKKEQDSPADPPAPEA